MSKMAWWFRPSVDQCWRSLTSPYPTDYHGRSHCFSACPSGLLVALFICTVPLHRCLRQADVSPSSLWGVWLWLGQRVWLLVGRFCPGYIPFCIFVRFFKSSWRIFSSIGAKGHWKSQGWQEHYILHWLRVWCRVDEFGAARCEWYRRCCILRNRNAFRDSEQMCPLSVVLLVVGKDINVWNAL